MSNCKMVVGFTTNEHGDNTGDVACGRPAIRDDCCEECFRLMIEDDDFSPEELEIMYPLIAAKTTGAHP